MLWYIKLLTANNISKKTSGDIVMKIFLKDVRTKKGITTIELSNMTGISQSHITNIENGNKMPTVPKFCKLAKALNVSCHELFECEDSDIEDEDKDDP